MKRTLFAAMAGACLLLVMGFADQEVGLDNDIAGSGVGLDNDLASGGYTGDEPLWNGDTLTIVFTAYPDEDPHNHSEFATWLAAADSIVDLSDAAHGFAYGVIDTNYSYDPITTIDATTTRSILWPTENLANRWQLNYLNASNKGRRHELFYIPFENYIPAGAQVTYAEIKGTLAATLYLASQDSICATLMTNPNDNVWYTSLGVTTAYAMPMRAHVSWRVQVAGLNTIGYPADDAGAWDPHWNDREYFWDVGDYSDWTGLTDGAGPLAANEEFNIKIPNCVQAAVNGKVNNGICLTVADRDGSAQPAAFFCWDPTATSRDDDSKYVVVQYIKKPYKSPWPNGLDFAVNLQTDDGRRQVNEAYADTLEAYGGKFSMMLDEALYNNGSGVAGDATHVDEDSILAWFDRGLIDVVNHNFSTALGTIGDSTAVGEYTDGMYPDELTANATQWDQVLYELDPEWIFQWAESMDRDELRGDPDWGAMTSQSTGGFNASAAKAVAYHGFPSYRVQEATKNAKDIDGNIDPYVLPIINAASADTVYLPTRPHNTLLPRSLIQIANSIGIDDIVDAKVDNPSETVVKLRTRAIIEDIRASGKGVFSFLAHDIKDPDDAPGSYSTGIDRDELGWMCEVIAEYGDPYMTFGEVTRWLQQYATPVPTPPAYSQPDTFELRADDNAWFVPDGRNGIFIPGVKTDYPVPPDYPTGVEANAYENNGNYYAVVAWNYNQERDLDYYSVYRSDFVDDDPSVIGTAQAPFTYFSDHSLEADSTYYYHVTAVDEDGNESRSSSQVSVTPTEEVVYIPVEILAADAVQHVDADGDSLRIEVSITLNKDAHVKMVSWWDGNDAESWHQSIPADTSTSQSAAFSWHALDTEDDVMFDTAIPSPVADADSTINLVWTYTDPDSNEIWPDPPSVVQLERNHNYSPSYTEVTHTMTGADSAFTHGPDGDPSIVSVRRGIENYRIRGMGGSYESPRDITGWDYLDSPYFNQAVWVVFVIHADDGTSTTSSNLVFFPYSVEYEPSGDAEPPSSVFASVAYDTTSDGASNVILEVKAEAKEPANAWWVWKDAYDGDWWPASEVWTGSYKAGDDTVASFALQDTIHTEVATSALDTVHVGYYPKDKSQNVGDLVYGGSFPFTRISDATWTGHTVISNHAAHDSTGCDNWVSFGESFSFDTADSTDSDSNWGSTSSDYPMQVGTTRATSLWISQGTSTYKLPVLSFGPSTNFVGAKIDSAKLYVFSHDPIPSKLDSMYIWGMTNAEFQDWDDNDASVAYKDVSKSTLWTDTNRNLDSYFNLFDLCGTGPPYDCAGELGGIGISVAMTDYGRSVKSWNSAIDVTEIVQEQADNDLDLYFLFHPYSSPWTKVVWAISNEDDADAQFRPRLEVWVSEDN